MNQKRTKNEDEKKIGKKGGKGQAKSALYFDVPVTVLARLGPAGGVKGGRVG